MVALLLFAMTGSIGETLESEICLLNSSFEHEGHTNAIYSWDEIAGWQSNSDGTSGIKQDLLAAPVQGKWVAFQKGGGSSIYQTIGHHILENTTYRFKLWARSLNRLGNTSPTITEIGLSANHNTIVSTVTSVNPVQLKGASVSEPNDDGGNVWIDNGMRHQFSDIHMYQSLNKNPLMDP